MTPNDKTVWGLDTNVLIRYCQTPEKYAAEYDDGLDQRQLISWLDGMMDRRMFYMLRRPYEELSGGSSPPGTDLDMRKRLLRYAASVKPPYIMLRDLRGTDGLWWEAKIKVDKIFLDIGSSAELQERRDRWFEIKGYTEMPSLRADKDVLDHAYIARRINPDWKIMLLSYDRDIVHWKKELDDGLGINIVDAFRFGFGRDPT